MSLVSTGDAPFSPFTSGWLVYLAVFARSTPPAASRMTSPGAALPRDESIRSLSNVFQRENELVDMFLRDLHHNAHESDSLPRRKLLRPGSRTSKDFDSYVSDDETHSEAEISGMVGSIALGKLRVDELDRPSRSASGSVEPHTPVETSINDSVANDSHDTPVMPLKFSRSSEELSAPGTVQAAADSASENEAPDTIRAGVDILPQEEFEVGPPLEQVSLPPPDRVASFGNDREEDSLETLIEKATPPREQDRLVSPSKSILRPPLQISPSKKLVAFEPLPPKVLLYEQQSPYPEPSYEQNESDNGGDDSRDSFFQLQQELQQIERDNPIVNPKWTGASGAASLPPPADEVLLLPPPVPPRVLNLKFRRGSALSVKSEQGLGIPIKADPGTGFAEAGYNSLETSGAGFAADESEPEHAAAVEEVDIHAGKTAYTPRVARTRLLLPHRRSNSHYTDILFSSMPAKARSEANLLLADEHAPVQKLLQNLHLADKQQMGAGWTALHRRQESLVSDVLLAGENERQLDTTSPGVRMRPAVFASGVGGLTDENVEQLLPQPEPVPTPTPPMILMPAFDHGEGVHAPLGVSTDVSESEATSNDLSEVLGDCGADTLEEHQSSLFNLSLQRLREPGRQSVEPETLPVLKPSGTLTTLDGAEVSREEAGHDEPTPTPSPRLVPSSVPSEARSGFTSTSEVFVSMDEEPFEGTQAEAGPATTHEASVRLGSASSADAEAAATPRAGLVGWMRSRFETPLDGVSNAPAPSSQLRVAQMAQQFRNMSNESVGSRSANSSRGSPEADDTVVKEESRTEIPLLRPPSAAALSANFLHVSSDESGLQLAGSVSSADHRKVSELRVVSTGSVGTLPNLSDDGLLFGELSRMALAKTTSSGSRVSSALLATADPRSPEGGAVRLPGPYDDLYSPQRTLRPERVSVAPPSQPLFQTKQEDTSDYLSIWHQNPLRLLALTGHSAPRQLPVRLRKVTPPREITLVLKLRVLLLQQFNLQTGLFMLIVPRGAVMLPDLLTGLVEFGQQFKQWAPLLRQASGASAGSVSRLVLVLQLQDVREPPKPRRMLSRDYLERHRINNRDIKSSSVRNISGSARKENKKLRPLSLPAAAPVLASLLHHDSSRPLFKVTSTLPVVVQRQFHVQPLEPAMALQSLKRDDSLNTIRGTGMRTLPSMNSEDVKRILQTKQHMSTEEWAEYKDHKAHQRVTLHAALDGPPSQRALLVVDYEDAPEIDGAGILANSSMVAPHFLTEELSRQPKEIPRKERAFVTGGGELSQLLDFDFDREISRFLTREQSREQLDGSDLLLETGDGASSSAAHMYTPKQELVVAKAESKRAVSTALDMDIYKEYRREAAAKKMKEEEEEAIPLSRKSSRRKSSGRSHRHSSRRSSRRSSGKSRRRSSVIEPVQGDDDGEQADTEEMLSDDDAPHPFDFTGNELPMHKQRSGLPESLLAVPTASHATPKSKRLLFPQMNELFVVNPQLVDVTLPAPRTDNEVERGRLFLRVEGLKNLMLPDIDAHGASFLLMLDNGIHCVKTPEYPMKRELPIGQEFELTVQQLLDFILTFKASYEPVRNELMEVREVQTTKLKRRLSRMFGGKERHVVTRLVERPRVDTWNHVVATDGSFGRCYIDFSQYELPATGKVATFEVTVFNEWETVLHPTSGEAVARAPTRVGQLEVKMLYLPRTVEDEVFPTSIRTAHHLLQRVMELLGHELEAYLYQEGGDCELWKRRLFKLHGTELIAHNEMNGKPRARINLLKALEVVWVGKAKVDPKRYRNFSDMLLVDYAFKLRFYNGEVIDFGAQSKPEWEQWTLVLDEIVSKNRFRRQPWVRLMQQEGAGA